MYTFGNLWIYSTMPGFIWDCSLAIIKCLHKLSNHIRIILTQRDLNSISLSTKIRYKEVPFWFICQACILIYPFEVLSIFKWKVFYLNTFDTDCWNSSPTPPIFDHMDTGRSVKSSKDLSPQILPAKHFSVQ